MENKKDYTIILDNGHGVDTKGKQSPDGQLKEYLYTREIVQDIYKTLTKLGYKAHILVPEQNDIPLSERVKRSNKIYSENNKAILVSVHCNALGSGTDWCSARGWSVFVSQNASTNSKKLAECLEKAASSCELKIRKQYPDKAYWVQSLAICRDTKCPAILTENLFQDNKEDVKFLLSDEGKKIITKIHVDGIIDYLNN